MSSGGSGGDVPAGSASSSPAPVMATRSGAMPKLPPRPSAKPAADAPQVGVGSGSSDGGAAADTTIAQPSPAPAATTVRSAAAAAVPAATAASGSPPDPPSPPAPQHQQHQQQPAGGVGGETSTVPGSSNATTIPTPTGTGSPAATSASPRPSAGPSLPPRTARPKATGGSGSSNEGDGASTAAGLAAAAAAPAASAPPPTPAAGPSGGSGSSSGSGSGAAAGSKASSGAAAVSASSSGGGGGGGSGGARAAATAGSSPGGSGGGAAAASSGSGTRRGGLMGGLSGLPPRPQQQQQQQPPAGPVLDPDEPESVAEVRRSIHAVRVQMISAALRLGYDHENALVKQVLYRLALAERLKAPWRRPGKRPDPVAAAAREAARLTEEAAGAAGGELAPLGLTVKIMLIGLQGSGKTQLAHALLGGGGGGGGGGPVGRSQPPHTAVHPFEGATSRVTLLRGSAPGGIGLEFVDTPGLSLAPGGAARNCQVLQQIRRAYHTHRPDLLVYVDRLDAPTPSAGPAAGPGAALSPGGAGAELGVLRNLTAALGPAVWLNTIVAFTHAGSPPPTAPRSSAPRPSTSTSSSSAPAPAHSGPSFENWLEMRSHALQGVIRQASYDERLMNPVAFAESHPACPTNTAGQPVIYNGMPWRSHLLLMITSAKLLADTEALLQMQQGGGRAGGGGGGGGAGGGGWGGGADAAAGGAGGGAGGGGARQVPLSYIMQQVTQMSRPLKFPDHRNVMDVRRARTEAARLPLPRQRRDAARQVALRVLGLRQGARKARDMAESYRRATAAGCKVAVEPPRVAKRCRPSAQPLEGFRYRAPEAQGGWVVRPNIEQHCADVSDGIEGFVINKVAVAAPGKPGEADGLKGYGVPYHHYMSLQFTKDQRMLAARSEATVYHDPLGAATTSLSADVQTSAAGGGGGLAGGGGGGDVLVLLRSDTRLRPPKGSRLPKMTLGAVAARVGEEARLPLGVRLPVPRRGSSALGLRLQAIQKARIGAGAAPLRLAVSAAALQRTSELSAGRLGLGLRLGRPRWLGGRGLLNGAGGGGGGGGGGGFGGGFGGGDACCLGASAEAVVDLADVLDLPLARRLPGAVGATLMRSPEGDTTAVLSSSVQYQLGAAEMVALRANWDKRGRAGLSLRLKTVSGWWAGLVAMLVPLGRLAADSISDALRRMRAHRMWRRQQQQQAAQKQQQQQQQKSGVKATKPGAKRQSQAEGHKATAKGAASKTGPSRKS